MNNETATCQYCDKNAIGYERVYGTPINTQVCEDCAHVETTVHLYSGGTWRKPPAPTPGPWSVHTDDNGKHSVLGFGPLAHLGDSPRALANARLMAAAPSLLAALADLIAACPDNEIGTCPLLAAAHDAITKAGVDRQTVDL